MYNCAFVGVTEALW